MMEIVIKQKIYDNPIFSIMITNLDEVVGAPEGIESINKAYPDTHVIVAAVDEGLDEKNISSPDWAISATASLDVN